MRATLEDVCQKGSSSLMQKDIEGRPGAYPIYGASGLISFVDFFHQAKPCVAVVKDGAGIGRAMLLPAYSSVIGTMQYLIPKDNVLPKYLYYVVSYMHLSKYYTGATIPHIYFKDYKREEFNLHDKGEQTRIIDVLSRIERIIEARRNELTSLDNLIKAQFVETFGDMADPQCTWQTCRLVDACENSDDIKCGPFGTQLSKNEYQPKGIPVWEIPQINSSFAIAPEHFLTEEKAKQLQAYSLSHGDIVMSRKGNVGKCALFPLDRQSGILHSDVLRIRVSSNKADACFMMCQLHFSRDVLRQIEQVSSGAIMAGVNVTKLKEIRIKLPPIELQKQFASFVAQIDKSKFRCDTSRNLWKYAVKCIREGLCGRMVL